MKTIGNIIWIIVGGFCPALSWFLTGLLLCITIVFFPFGVQCFKIAGLQLMPFGKKVVDDEGAGCASFFLNIIWMITCGLVLAIENCLSALLFAVTIIGIPFAKQSLKLAALALAPFGKRIESE